MVESYSSANEQIRVKTEIVTAALKKHELQTKIELAKLQLNQASSNLDKAKQELTVNKKKSILTKGLTSFRQKYGEKANYAVVQEFNELLESEYMTIEDIRSACAQTFLDFVEAL